ncbi:MAG: hypothetical protein P8P83_05000 [Rickettsiaceae bacterium]|nr:hypothetical protein [Rickettsiaceae bacterium]
MHCSAVGLSKRENWETVEWLLKQENIDPYANDSNGWSVADQFAQVDIPYANEYLELVGAENIALHSDIK